MKYHTSTKTSNCLLQFCNKQLHKVTKKTDDRESGSLATAQSSASTQLEIGIIDHAVNAPKKLEMTHEFYSV